MSTSTDTVENLLEKIVEVRKTLLEISRNHHLAALEIKALQRLAGLKTRLEAAQAREAPRHVFRRVDGTTFSGNQVQPKSSGVSTYQPPVVTGSQSSGRAQQKPLGSSGMKKVGDTYFTDPKTGQRMHRLHYQNGSCATFPAGQGITVLAPGK